MKNILCYGDSNTWAYDYTTFDPAIGAGGRIPFDERWTGIVQNNLGPEYRIIEDALNGRTCMQDDPYNPLRNGLDSIQIALDAQAPLDLVVIQIGCNELKHAFSLTPGMIAYGAEKLVSMAEQSYYNYPAPKILLICPAPTHPNIENQLFGYVFGPDAYKKSLELGKWYKDIAERHNCGYIDCADLNFKLNELDGLHYCREDHKKLGEAVTLKIKEMLG